MNRITDDLQNKIDYLRTYSGRRLRLMEVCGTHTSAIFRGGIRSLISPNIRLISGPGCPVCVTPTAYIDKCTEFALKPGCALVSFGDMLKVPGSGHSANISSGSGSLSDAMTQGGRVEMVYSPFDVIAKAQAEPETLFVVAAVGFETTAPAYGLLLGELIANDIGNVKLLTALKTTLPAIEWILKTEPSVDGFIAPGHVSVITGSGNYEPLAAKYKRPFVVAGFEEFHLISAIYELVRMATDKATLLSNFYPEAVSEKGNVKAQEVIRKYFETGSAVWRGLGSIASSGLYLRPGYEVYDIGSRGLDEDAALPEGCRCGDVITGRIDPADCPMFSVSCTPNNAKGPCMVSTEGACGIWYQNI
ncbi:MAG: hydrogenase formation protein HypD [Clostridiales Family XIII bacterium]|jgi:hydrogenase expression/formation protein HypD|nr:hydrogenase formation protein HypD [Clostridiales Family XIII bacterium]